MNYILRDIANCKAYQSFIENKTYPITLSGLVCVAKSSLIAKISKEENKPILVITYNEIQATRIIKDLSFYLDNVLFFPKKEIAIYDYDVESNDIAYKRIDILNKINSQKPYVIVTTIEAVAQSMISKDDLFHNTIKLNANSTIDLEKIKETLVNLGYTRKPLVENRGEFSIRGGIIDIGTEDSSGIRIELWGDEIDSIRKFKISSQRSTEMVQNVEIYPAKENILVESAEEICKRIKEIDAKSKYQNPNILSDIQEINNGNYENKIDKYFNEFYKDQSTLIDYVEGYRIFIDEPEKVNIRIDGIKEDNKNLIKELALKEKQVPEALKNLTEYEFKEKKVINLKEADEKNNHFQFREVNLFKGDANNFKEDIKESIRREKKIIVLAGSKENANKISKMLETNIITDDLDNLFLKPGQVVICTGALSGGFENIETNLQVISSDEFLNPTKKHTKRANDTFKNSEQVVFADLKVGDLVVHRNHGVAVFSGVKTIDIEGVTKDFIGLQYRGGDTLYVPTENLDNVRKYIGQDSGVTLNKLGTKEWQETKAKVKGNLRAIAKDLIALYARREHSKGFAFSKDTPWQQQFESSFPYQETNDQLRCIEEVKKDMESSRPMDRLLCGDVGYGKTEVAIRAAFKAVMDGKQVAYLAPTTILANQQYQEFKERMKEYPVKIELLNRFRTAKQQKETVQKLKLGETDIVLGTHRMLSKDVEFSNLGLLIVDEEQRFGVKAKEKIKKYKENVDVLTMTATPIPRTLQLSIVGIRDMSVIYEPPQNRKPIQTYVLEYDKEVIREAIIKELERDGQVFYIFNNVGAIANKALEVENLVPEAKTRICTWTNDRIANRRYYARFH